MRSSACTRSSSDAPRRQTVLPSADTAATLFWALLASEPYAYLHDVLQRMVDGHPVNRAYELLPWS